MVNWQAEDTREPMVQFKSKGWQAQDPGRAKVSIWVRRQEKKKKANVTFKGSQAGRNLSYLEEGQPFCSIQAFDLLYGTHSH